MNICNYLLNTNSVYKFVLENLSWQCIFAFQFCIYIYLFSLFVISLYKINSIYGSYNSIFIFILIINLLSYSGPISSFWFNHLITTNVTLKVNISILLTWLVLNTLVTSNSYVNVINCNQLMIFLSFLTLWIATLFNCSNLFTLVFYFELITVTLMTLLALTNNYSTLVLTNKNLRTYNYTIRPFYQTYSIILFFWISFITSFNLFFYILYYIYFMHTFDLYLIEYVLRYFKTTYTFYELINIYFLWFGLLFTFMLKLGLVPFFFWKPNFFKGINSNYLTIYVIYFYFIFFVFLVLLISNFLNELISLFVVVNLIVMYIGIFILIITLFNVSNFKIFISYSSILNTLLVFIYIFFKNIQNMHYVYF